MRQKKTKWLFFLLMSLSTLTNKVLAQTWDPNHSVGTINGIYHFSYSQTPAQLVELYPAGFNYSGYTYQWEQSAMPTTGFTDIAGATQTSYSFSGPLSQTTYYRRRTTGGGSSGNYVRSNTIKIQVVSANWEDLNYIREHDINTTGITTWQAVDQLAIGPKLQSTTYIDALGRPVQKVSRETATPTPGNSLWGDVVEFSLYDQMGREPVKNLPYTTTTQSGKYKTTPLSEQTQYYSTTYNETSAFLTITFDNSPYNRLKNIKEPGAAWAAGAGKSAASDINSADENVKLFSISVVGFEEVATVSNTYEAKMLHKTIYTDENGKKVIQYYNFLGQLILKKVQLDNNPSVAHVGWLCSYYIYDQFGRLRFELSPEAVNYMDINGWSFAGTTGQQILDGWCFQYRYDEKGRNIWKKMPGAAPMNMLYDVRDRLVFSQDGNQAALSTPQWTATLYDELDRPLLTTLYNTTKTIATLQSDINNAAAVSTVSIANSANTGGATIALATSLSPLSYNDLNTTTITTVLNFFFYDNYSFANVKTFNTAFTNLSAYNTSDPNVQAIAKTNRTTGMLTGSKTRIMGTYNFLNGTSYYDERGSLIQNLGDNIKTGTDITTLQYHFDGRVLSSCSDHTTTGTGYTNFITLTKNLFDKLGRVTSVQKQFGSNSIKTVSSYDYDDMGRIKTKHLDPGYTAGGNTELESLTYSFNIHSQLTGINKDYALKNGGGYNKWGHFFGLYIGYTNSDNVFAQANLTGQATGVLWNTQGDDAQRKYDYSYDNAGRLINAAFKEQQHSGDGWTNAKMDFSVTGTNGNIAYDLNGNLLNMQQKGVIPGAAPIVMDNLQYSYASFSNKLQSVADLMTATGSNGKSGDFKDGANGSNADYVYDANGNLVIDLNKNAKDLENVVGANGIKYNFLDKPEKIRIAGKGTITIVYSGSGGKLQRTFTPEGSGTLLTTTYINQFVYQSSGGGADALSFISFEEGRIRVMTPTSQNNGYDALQIDGNITLPNNKKGVFDYYIMDHLQNVRMILTEEIHTAVNTATMETSRASVEEPVFGQAGGGNEVAATRYAAPSAWQNSNIGGSVSRLGNNAGHNMGPNALQKVMGGDNISATVLYYHQATTGGNNTGFVSTVLAGLLQTLSNSGAAANLVKDNATAITNQLTVNPGFVSAVQPSASSSSTPLAYLTVLFFDERFNFIDAADGGVVQQQVAASVGSGGSSLTMANVKAPKNGYAYVYVSNQSNEHVYFDNLVVNMTAGNILEENHYYSYGLKIAAISSKKLANINEGDTKNNHQYQGAYSEFDDDLGWNDFALRNYDPQTGRWVQPDPYQEFSSPYVGMGNDPINNTDPSGGSILSGASAIGTAAATTIIGAVAGGVVDAITTGKDKDPGYDGVLIGALAGLGAGTLNIMTSTALVIQAANTASAILNKPMPAQPAGNSGHGPSHGGEVDSGDSPQQNNGTNFYFYASGELARSEPSTDDNDHVNIAFSIGFSWGRPIIIYQELNTNAFKQFVAIVVGESSNSFEEAKGIGKVMLNRMAATNTVLDENFVDKIGGAGQYDAIGEPLYNSIMNQSIDETIQSRGIADRVKGAISSLSRLTTDKTNGAYIWNATNPQTGYNWRQYNRKVYVITAEIGKTTFFKYNPNKSENPTTYKRKWP